MCKESGCSAGSQASPSRTREVRQSLINRGDSTELLDRLLADDARRRAILVEVEELKHQRNEASAKIAR